MASIPERRQDEYRRTVTLGRFRYYGVIFNESKLAQGTGPSCPGDAKRPAGTTCRTAAGPCDVAEVCDGSNNACPANVLRPPGFVCKPAGASAISDPADTCDGRRTSCPANFAPYGTSCGTSMTCNGIDRCL